MIFLFPSLNKYLITYLYSQQCAGGWGYSTEPKQTRSLPSQTVQFSGVLGINHVTYTVIRADEKELTAWSVGLIMINLSPNQNVLLKQEWGEKGVSSKSFD